MRPIDADALVEDRTIQRGEETIGIRNFVTFEEIEEAPTISMHVIGGWVLMSDADGYYYCCSRCGEELPRYMKEDPTWDRPFPLKYSIGKTNYCPSCGARMI